jgi:hypothetical protein
VDLPKAIELIGEIHIKHETDHSKPAHW